ncbi:MAG: ATP-binding protein [Acidobacteria bacterium]|nr:ATP-binding protein [Acidobacteriota bacterium]
MSTVLPSAAVQPAAIDDFEVLSNMLSMALGEFSLIYITYDLPSTRQRIQQRLRERFAQRNLAAIDVYEIPADDPNRRSENLLDHWPSLVRLASPQGPPDVLFVNGLERLMAQGVDRAIQPLNMARNRLRAENPYPVVIWLPERWMPEMYRFPDLTSWRSGSFFFRGDPERVRTRAAQLAERGEGPLSLIRRFVGRNRVPDAVIEEISGILPDAEAAGSPLVPRLREIIAAAPAAPVLAAPDEAGMAPLRGLITDRLLVGRDRDVAAIVASIQHVLPRFLVVWGESGCGQSLLLAEGVAPELQRRGILAIVVDGGYGDLIGVLESRFVDLNGEKLPIEAAVRRTGKTVTIILDQFEKFFRDVISATERQKVLQRLASLVDDVRVPMRLVIGIRADALGRVLEFGDRLDPLEVRKRYELKDFDTGAARDALESIGRRRGAGWAADRELLNEVIQDLASDARVKPIDVRLMAAAMSCHRVKGLGDYRTKGGHRPLLGSLIRKAIAGLSRKLTSAEWLQLLTTLVDDPPARLTLPVGAISSRSGLDLQRLKAALAELTAAELVRETEKGEYELVHDALVVRVLTAKTDSLQDRGPRRWLGVVA